MVFLQSPPHLALQNYIAQYIYTSFNTAILPSLKQTFLAYDVPSISFFMEGASISENKIHLGGSAASPGSPILFAYFNALTTASNSIYFNADKQIKSLIVIFKPAGFSAFFPGNMTELTNQLPDFLLLAGAKEGFQFLEQLGEAKNFTTQVSACDKFFLKRVKLASNSDDQIREACRQLIISEGIINIKELAYRTNMSLRTLERKFTNQVGVSPKTFARFKRFHHSLSTVNDKRFLSWSNIASHCGYYDQAHFIKEFKFFTNQSPAEYSPSEYMLYNQIILHRNFIAF